MIMTQRFVTLFLIICMNHLMEVSSESFEFRDETELLPLAPSDDDDDGHGTIHTIETNPDVLSQDAALTKTVNSNNINPNSDLFTLVNLSSLSTVKDENASYLDIFGEFSKEYILHHFIPPTNVQCDWDWHYLRCEPFCLCDIQYKFGDYHLGRSCRLRESSSSLQEQETESTDFKTTCHLPPNTKAYKVINGIGNLMRLGWKKVNLPKKVDRVKDQVCSSLDQTISLIHATYHTDAMDEQQQQQQQQQEHWNDSRQEDHHPSDATTTTTMNSSSHGFLEKPVRALRRSLKCHHDEDESN